jgi:hypothetical protein
VSKNNSDHSNRCLNLVFLYLYLLHFPLHLLSRNEDLFDWKSNEWILPFRNYHPKVQELRLQFLLSLELEFLVPIFQSKNFINHFRNSVVRINTFAWAFSRVILSASSSVTSIIRDDSLAAPAPSSSSRLRRNFSRRTRSAFETESKIFYHKNSYSLTSSRSALSFLCFSTATFSHLRHVCKISSSGFCPTFGLVYKSVLRAKNPKSVSSN